MIVRKNEGKQVPIGEENWTFYLTGDDTDGRFDIIEGEIGYLNGPPLHTHQDQHDTFVVLEGTLTLQVGDDLFELKAGDVATAPPGTPHTYTNLDKEKKARILNLMTPGHFDKAINDFSKLTPEDIEGEKVMEVAARHKVAIVGPPIPVKLGLV
ncbi:MAG: cupin domain-containing protein [Pyrinomonadaceae bacterium]